MLSTLRRSTGIGAATATALLFRRAASSAAAAEAAAKKTGKKKEEAPGIIGIDLGTTNSCCAVWERGEARVLENAEGARTTPSVVAFAPSAAAQQQQQQLASVVVGAAARRQGVTNAANTIFATKRLVGRRFEDPTVQHMRSAVPYKIVRGPNGDAWVETTDGRQHSASEIGAHVLARMKETADRHMGVGANASKRAVITCPAYFNDAQRQATKDAGRIAGLDVLRIINEPTAAALAYGLRSSDNGKVVAVFDLGGGTFDISVLEIAGGVFEVKATNGDTFLGGEDFDNALVAHLAAEFRAAHPKSAAAARLVALLQQGSTSDDRDARLALQRLREAAERAKCELSSAPVAEVNLPFLAVDAAAGGAPLHLQTKITRAQFEALTEPLVRRTISPVRQCLADAKMRPSDVSEVVLVGGMTRMPRVIDEVRKVFGKEPFRGVNPDEAVAIGAAVQGGVLEGSVKSVVLLDVTPLSLGIETLGGVFTKLIDRNTTIPAKRSQVFSTADDFQSEVEVKVFQGERSMARDNKLLGSFFLTGIPPLPRGQAQIDVSFDIDTNGIVHVRARDRRSGKEQSIRIEPAGGLSELEIQKIVSQAEALKEKDAQDRALAEARNAAETVVRAAQEALREHGKKVALAAASNVTREIEAVKKAAAASDPDAITRASANLREVTMQTFASAFAEQQQQPTAPAPTSPAADASPSSSSSQQEKK